MIYGKYVVLLIIIISCFSVGALICTTVFRGEKYKPGKYRIRRVLLAYFLGLLLLALVFFGYVTVYKHPNSVAHNALRGNSSVIVEKTRYGYFMDGPGKDSAFVFYPGEKVAVECYAPLMQQIAEKGVDVFMMDMPFNMPFLNRNAANKVIGKEDYKSWYVGGHSLGGVTASRYAGKNGEKVDGVILFASSPTNELPDDLHLLSVCASLDGILSEEEYQKNKENWPAQSTEYVIKGGNHTNFANCTMMRGDNEATTIYTTQQRLCAQAVIDFIIPASSPDDETVDTSDGSDDTDQSPADNTAEPEINPSEKDTKEKPVLLADRLNDNSELWSGEYVFPENENDIYTSMGNYCYMHVISLASQEHSDTVVIYIHGGAYIGDFDNEYYYPVAKQITMDTGYEVLVPQYPLLTGFNYTHAYICLQSLYYRVVAEYGSDHVIVMGDSSGGALAAGLCLQAAENNWEQPSQLVLVSPWVDLMITHPETDRYQELDKDLDAYMLRLYGEYWAAGDNPSDYHLSPLYGNVSAFRNVTLYYGDSELFTPTEQLFYEKMSDRGVVCEQIIGEGMGHNCAIANKDMLHDLCDRMVTKQLAADEAA